MEKVLWLLSMGIIMVKNKVKNSFLIVTNRRYDKHAKIAVDQLESCGALDNGEIVVCCPFEIPDKRIKYIKDNKQQNGNVAFYVDLCKNLKKGAHHVSLEGEKT